MPSERISADIQSRGASAGCPPSPSSPSASCPSQTPGTTCRRSIQAPIPSCIMLYIDSLEFIFTEFSELRNDTLAIHRHIQMYITWYYSLLFHISMSAIRYHVYFKTLFYPYVTTYIYSRGLTCKACRRRRCGCAHRSRPRRAPSRWPWRTRAAGAVGSLRWAEAAGRPAPAM